MEFRPFYFAREWVRAGHQVEIAAGSYSHIRARNPAMGRPLRREVLDGVTYRWLWTPCHRGNGAGRVLNIAVFLGWLMLLAPWYGLWKRPQVVIASSTYPLDIVPARLIAWLAGARLLYEVHDLWPLSPIELGGMSPAHPFIRVMQWGEDYACRHCDVCVSLLPAALNHLKSHGLDGRKYLHVPNGVDLDEWDSQREPLPAGHLERLASLRARRPFLLGYLGTHGLANALDTLLDAALLTKDSPVGYVLIGSGPDKERLTRRALELGLEESVLFLDPVGKRQVPAALAELDALYIGLQRQPLFRFGISPNKIFDYMMAGRPVINGVEGGNDPVAEAGCGLSVPAENPAALARAILRLHAMSAAERRELGRNGRAFVEERHQIKDLAARMLQGPDVRTQV
jgi:glycosyltransferase involved in cell wall biosynthesis